MRISSFNPISPEYEGIKEFKALSFKHKAITGLITALAALISLPILGLGGVATFRYFSHKFTMESAEKANRISQTIFVIQKSEVKADEVQVPIQVEIPPPLPSEDLNEKNAAALKIQKSYRGYRARAAFKTLKSEHLEKQKAQIIKIQRLWRGYSARLQLEKKGQFFWGRVLLKKAKAFLDSPTGLQGVPRAATGLTHVYLPKGLPFVLKASGSPKNQERFDQMQSARLICQKSRYTRLVIPKGHVHGNFLIESKLPISPHDTKRQIGFYIENHSKFGVAVSEFTGLLCQASLPDIVGGSTDPYEKELKVDLGRYDNLPLYLENGKGVIGLIDLEGFTPIQNRGTEAYYLRCKNAVHLFPYHLNEILGMAIRFDPGVDKYRSQLEVERDKVLKCFKVIYEDHKAFLEEKGIKPENPSQMVEISLDTREAMKKNFVSFLRKVDKEGFYKGVLGENPEEMIPLVEESFSIILDSVMQFISRRLKAKVEQFHEPISARPELLACRSFIFTPTSKMLCEEVLWKAGDALKMLKTESDTDLDAVALLATRTMFQELASQKLIAHFNPNFQNGRWLFFL